MLEIFRKYNRDYWGFLPRRRCNVFKLSLINSNDIGEGEIKKYFDYLFLNLRYLFKASNLLHNLLRILIYRCYILSIPFLCSFSL